MVATVVSMSRLAVVVHKARGHVGRLRRPRVGRLRRPHGRRARLGVEHAIAPARGRALNPKQRAKFAHQAKLLREELLLAERIAARNKERVAQLTDPRVQAALNVALNGPNKLAADQYKGRNTTRVSAERRF